VVGPVAVVANPASGSTFPLGATSVGLTATDAAHNTATASFTVTVRDTKPPSITSLSSSFAVEAASAAGAVVNYAAAAAADLVTANPTITYSQASGTTFPLGTTTVTVTAKDAAGNISTSSLTIKVQA